MREKPYAKLGIYIMPDKAIMPTIADTPGMWSCDIEPIELFDFHNRNDFVAACKRAIERGIPQIPMPTEDEMYYDEQGPAMKEPVILKYTKLSNWDELEHKSILISIKCYPSGFVLRSWGHSKNGKWSDDKTLDEVLDTKIGIEGVVDTILEHLKTRKDLPGMNFEQSQQQTSKGF